MAFNITSHTKPEQITGYTYKNRPITLNKIPGNVFRPSDHKHWKKNVFPPEVQQHCAAIYAVTGDVKQAAEVAKVPVNIVKKWKEEPWFNRVLAEIREENKDKLDGKISEILDVAMEKLRERLESGDEAVHYKTGQRIVTPVKAKDLASIASTVHKVRSLDRGTPTSISGGATDTTEQKLGKLAEAFAELAKKQRATKTFDVTDAEVVIENEPKALGSS